MVFHLLRLNSISTVALVPRVKMQYGLLSSQSETAIFDTFAAFDPLKIKNSAFSLKLLARYSFN